jgi:perosamine synthetase
MSTIWNGIANKIQDLYSDKEFLPLHEPEFSGNESKYVDDCIKTGWVSSVGKYVDNFESSLAEYVGVKRAVAVVNGTAALHISLKIVGVQPNDEVLIPALTFVATGNAVIYCGAIPHFIDVSKITLGIDPIKLEHYLEEIAVVIDGQCVNKHTNRKISAIVPMHTFGHPVDMDTLQEICTRYHITIVEDAAESLGSYYKDTHTGNVGKVSAMSFNGNKIITTGGGGAILTNDEKLADYAKHLTTTAKIPHRWRYEHDEVGYNYRMPNLNAALGLAQLEQIHSFIEKKRKLVNKYKELFTDYDGIDLFIEPAFAKSNYWLQTLIINDEKHDIEEALSVFNDLGVMARPIWEPLHSLKPYTSYPTGDLTVTNKLRRQVLNIPSSPYLGE